DHESSLSKREKRKMVSLRRFHRPPPSTANDPLPLPAPLPILFSNSAEASGTPPSGPAVADLSDADSYLENGPTVVTLCSDASIAIIKTSTVPVDPTTGCSSLSVGDQITYAFSVKNTGNVTLTNVTVTDLVAGVTVVEIGRASCRERGETSE